MPANTVKVDRTTRWGNHPAAHAEVAGAAAVEAFARWVRDEASEEWKRAAVSALGGRNLACWCKQGAPCHGDFLLAWVQGARRGGDDFMTVPRRLPG